MKKVISGKELYKVMQESVNLLCDTVKTTLGPKGCNSIIDHSDFSPFITNDGATIAKNIESEDVAVNTILEIAKEASLKTNDTVGDGTTTTLVLLQSIFNESLKEIEKGINPIFLKKELDKSLEKIIKELEKQKINTQEKHLKSIATIAANDEELGNLISQVYKKVKDRSAITIEEIEENKTELDYQSGYTFPISLASPYFLKENSFLSLKDSLILMINDFLNDIEQISPILNDVIHNKKSLVIITNDFEETFVQNIVSLHLNNQMDCYLIKIEEYGLKQRTITKDLEQITNAVIVEDISKMTSLNIGIMKSIHITKEQATIEFSKNEKMEHYIKKLTNEEQHISDSFEKDFIKKRIAMFTSGLVTIKLGAQTKTERREKKMRLVDALCAVESTKEGILPGGGISLLKLANQLKIQNKADKIFKIALTKPFEQILMNAGNDINTIKNTLNEKKNQTLFNTQTNQFEEIEKTNVIDSFAIIKNALKNATSIATMLLTTTSLIINEYEKKMTNDFDEL